MDYKSKYIKYKQKYIQLKNQFGGNFDAFLDAVKTNNYQKVKTMIDDNYINQKDNNLKTPLMYACEKGYDNIIMLLLSKSNSEYKISSYNLCKIKVEFLKSTFTNTNTNINWKDIDGWNSLMYACWKNHVNIVKLLLSKGADVNDVDNDKTSPLMIASQCGNINIVELLLKHVNLNVNISLKDKYGFDAFMCACWNNKINVIKLFEMECNYKFNYTGKVGLSNIGNTCWMNSIIQCLAHIDIFANIFINDEFKTNLTNNKKYLYTRTFINNFSNIIKSLVGVNNNISKEPIYIDNKDMNIFKNEIIKENNLLKKIINGKQQDAVEGFDLFEDILSEGLNLVTEKKNYIYEDNYEQKGMIVNNDESNISEIANLYVKRHREYRTNSLMDNLFEFITKQIFICVDDGPQYESIKFESMKKIMLEINNNLYISLDNYIKQEDITDQDFLRKCTKCHEKFIWKKNIFWSFPKILCIQLKRFDIKRNKIQTYMDFPFELDLYNYVGDPNKQTNNYKYELCSVCYHLGNSMSIGHYISICKCNDGWYKFDDSTVTRVNIKEIFNNNAYFLFYKHKQH